MHFLPRLLSSPTGLLDTKRLFDNKRNSAIVVRRNLGCSCLSMAFMQIHERRHSGPPSPEMFPGARNLGVHPNLGGFCKDWAS